MKRILSMTMLALVALMGPRLAYGQSGVPLWTNLYNGPGDYDDEAGAIAVDSGANALSQINTTTPALVLLDLDLPDINGMDVLSGIRKEFKGVKVIMLTNQSNPFIRKVCMSLGASYFFDKSTEFEKLPEAFQELLAAC